MVDTKGRLIVLENTQGKFVRTNPRIFDEANQATTLKGAIMQLETFDMDQDGHDDIVISDDSGELSILYGSLDTTGPKFTKKVLATDLGLKLTSESTVEGGALRWDGITEIVAPTQDQYLAESADLKDSSDMLSSADQKRLLDSKLYYVATVSKTVSSVTASDIRLNAGVGTDPENPGSGNDALIAKIRSDIANIGQKAASGSLNASALYDTTIEESKTYLRSEFVDAKNIVVAKTYRDKNAGTLQSGDRVEIRLSITNS